MNVESQKNCPYCHHSESIMTFTDNWNSELATKQMVLQHSAIPGEDNFLKLHLTMVKRLGYLSNSGIAQCVAAI